MYEFLKSENYKQKLSKNELTTIIIRYKSSHYEKANNYYCG